MSDLSQPTSIFRAVRIGALAGSVAGAALGLLLGAFISPSTLVLAVLLFASGGAVVGAASGLVVGVLMRLIDHLVPVLLRNRRHASRPALDRRVATAIFALCLVAVVVAGVQTLNPLLFHGFSPACSDGYAEARGTEPCTPEWGTAAPFLGVATVGLVGAGYAHRSLRRGRAAERHHVATAAAS